MLLFLSVVFFFLFLFVFKAFSAMSADPLPKNPVCIGDLVSHILQPKHLSKHP